MKKTILRILGLVIVVTLIGGGYYLYRNYSQAKAAQAAAVDIQTATVEEGNLVITIDATGKVRPRQTAMLSWKTSGTVESVGVAVDDEVKAGEVLASLAQTSLPQSVILAQADLVNAQTALQDLTTNADKAKTSAMKDIAQYAQQVRDAQYQLDNFTVPGEQAALSAMEALDLMKERLDQARAAFEPYKYLSSGNATRQQLKEALDEAQSDFNSAVKRLEYEYELQVAQDNLEKARQDYEKWKNGPDPAEVGAAKARIAAAQATLSQAWIEAPFAGTITVAPPLLGDQVTNNTQAFRLDDLSSLYVDLDISEVDVNRVQIGQPVSLTFDAIRGKEYHGKVTEIANIGSDTQGVVNFTVSVELSDADKDVRVGMTSAVEIVVSQGKKALLVPNQALRLENGAQVVYVMRPGQGLVPVKVSLGDSSDMYSEVLEGDLQAGDQVALNPPDTGSDQSMPRGMFFMRRAGGDNVAPAPGAGGNGGGQP